MSSATLPWYLDIETKKKIVALADGAAFRESDLKRRTTESLEQRWNRSGVSRPDPTGKFQNYRRLTGQSTGWLTGFWPARSTGFLQKVFLHYSMFLMKNFQNGGGHGWGVQMCDFRRGSEKKTQKNFCVFCKNDSILRLFLVKFWFKRLVLSSAKHAQNKHKKNWRAQAKLLDFFPMIFWERSINKVTIF